MRLSKRPPFDVLQSVQNKATRGFREVKLPENSDGDKSCWPTQDSRYFRYNDGGYKLAMAEAWAEHRQITEKGVVFYVDHLPAGYALFARERPGNINRLDKRLYGHPSGRYYDSAVKFKVHFLWLMGGMQGKCGCVFCSQNEKSSRACQLPLARPHQSRQTARKGTKRKKRSKTESEEDSSLSSDSGETTVSERVPRLESRPDVSRFRDEEGTEDVWKEDVKALQRATGTRGIEFDVDEDNSIDWKAEHRLVERYLTQIDLRHTFVPRLGEVVLWCADYPNDDDFILRDPDTGYYRFYSFQTQRFYSFPEWRGGVIAVVPVADGRNGPVDFADILDCPAKETSFNTSGFRVETIPGFGDDLSKSITKQYKYVPLRNIRPLSHWQMLVRGIPQDHLHRSVFNAVSSMTKLSLVDKYRINGTWPHATIFAKALYLGAELITMGDTVRLMPTDKNAECIDVLVVESIRLQIQDCRPENGQLGKNIFITLVGQAFTTEKSRSILDPVPLETAKSLFRPVGSAEYGPWYWLHRATEKYEVSYESVLGRLYEGAALRLWSAQSPSLGFDTASIVSGREYASQASGHILATNGDALSNWYLADSRAEALGISTMNGLEVGDHHDIRTPETLRSWRTHLEITNVDLVTESLSPLDLSNIRSA